MIEVSSFGPGCKGKRESTKSSREMDVDISFQVSTSSMYSQIDTRDKASFFRKFFYNFCSKRRDYIHKVSVVPEKDPEFIGHSKSNMLPYSFWESVESSFYPIICSLFATGRAESRFAGMGSFNAFSTFFTDKIVVSQETCSADQKFKNISNDTFSDQIAVLEE